MRTPAQRTMNVAVRLSSAAEYEGFVARAGRRIDSGKNIRETMAGTFARASKKKADWMMEGMVDVE